MRNSFSFLGMGSARTWYVVRKVRRALRHKCLSDERTLGAVQNWTWPSLVLQRDPKKPLSEHPPPQHGAERELPPKYPE